MQSMSWPQNQGTSLVRPCLSMTHDRRLVMTGKDFDVCISVAARGRVVVNARCEIKSVNGNWLATKLRKLRKSANISIWNSAVQASTNF
jgi:hypothetical protein